MRRHFGRAAHVWLPMRATLPSQVLLWASRGARPRTTATSTTTTTATATETAAAAASASRKKSRSRGSVAPAKNRTEEAISTSSPPARCSHAAAAAHTDSERSVHFQNSTTTHRRRRPQPLHALLHRPAAHPFIPAISPGTSTDSGPTPVVVCQHFNGEEPAFAPADEHSGVTKATPLTGHESAYDDLLNRSFMNPFTGKIAAVESNAYRQLHTLGFSLDAERPLCLRWRLADLEASCAAAVRKVSGRVQKGPQGDAMDLAAREARHGGGSLSEALFQRGLAIRLKSVQGAKRPARMATTDCTGGETTSTTAPSTPTGSARQWHTEVVQWLSRPDFALAIPTLLQNRYEELLSAYMPPKLDAVPDPSTAHVVLTPDQQHTLTLAKRGYHLFIGGSAGTGKTVLLKVIFRELAQRGLRVAMTATTGVAAVQLGGCTFHSAFDVPILTAHLCHDDSARAGAMSMASRVRRPLWDTNALRAVDVVIIDEVSLLNAQVLDAFDAEARLARLSTAPFGGIQVILCGDFLQLSHDAVMEALPAYLSAAFQHLVAVQLVTPMRHREGDPLLMLLQALRRGVFDAAMFADLDRPVPTEVESITYLFPRRREAQALNDAKLCELQTAELICTPQRGSLQLVGRFTASALIELPASMHSVPSRLAITAMLHEALQALRKHRADGSDCGSERRLAMVLAEPDVVVMPCALNQISSNLSFFVRVRLGHGSTPRSRAVKATTAPPQSTSCEQGPETDRRRRRAVHTTDAPSPPSVVAPVDTVREIDPDLWRAMCTHVATLLGGRLVTLYDQEPISLVPLSVSRVLSDLSHSSDAAEALSPLRVKLGCRVMVNRNLSRSVSNGSVGVVEAFVPPDLSLFPRHSDRSNHFLYKRLMEMRPFPMLPIVRLLSGEVVQIPPQSRMLGGTAATHFYGHEVFSVPLQLGYGFTVHKVQGLTLTGTVVLDCERFFECPHLLYVACSRVRSIDQLIVRHVKPNMVIVKRSALDFSTNLCEACDAQVLSPPPHLPRAAWTSILKPRVFSLSE